MKIKHILIPSVLAAALSTPALADKLPTAELASPLIELIPAFKEVRTELKLDEKQSKTVDAWMAEAPAKKKELRQNVLMARSELREALIRRESRIKRDELKLKLEEANRKVIELESLCARMLHTTLTKEQYAKVIAQYRTSVKS